MEITFIIPGKPVAKGRPRFSTAGKFVKTYTPEQTARYENLVKLMYQERANGRRFEDDEMISVVIEAHFEIPSSTSKKKKEAMLKDELRPITKCDLDNIMKIICDALNGVAYRDDSRIVAALLVKKYSENPCVIVTLKSWGINNGLE